MDIDFDKLIRLQKLDKEIRELSLFLESIPSKTAEFDRRTAVCDEMVGAAQARLAENQKIRRDLESQVQDNKEKIKKYKGQLNNVKTNKEYSSLLKEIDEVQKAIDSTEEEIITEMLEADELEENIRKAEEESAAAKKEIDAEKETLFAKQKEIETQKETLMRDRKDLIPLIPTDQLRMYQVIYERNLGIALSPVTDEFCSMCHMRIRPQMVNEIKAEMEIHLCENCGRILYCKKEAAETA